MRAHHPPCQWCAPLVFLCLASSSNTALFCPKEKLGHNSIQDACGWVARDCLPLDGGGGGGGARGRRRARHDEGGGGWRRVSSSRHEEGKGGGGVAGRRSVRVAVHRIAQHAARARPRECASVSLVSSRTTQSIRTHVSGGRGALLCIVPAASSGRVANRLCVAPHGQFEWRVWPAGKGACLAHVQP